MSVKNRMGNEVSDEFRVSDVIGKDRGTLGAVVQTRPKGREGRVTSIRDGVGKTRFAEDSDHRGRRDLQSTGKERNWRNS